MDEDFLLKKIGMSLHWFNITIKAFLYVLDYLRLLDGLLDLILRRTLAVCLILCCV